MDWQAILGSVVVAGLVSSVGGAITTRLTDEKLEIVKAQLTKNIESTKSELSVWAKFRGDTLQDMWKAYREVVAGMTSVILEVQELQQKNAPATRLSPTINAYRRVVHAQIDLLTPDAVEVAQRFLETSYEVKFGRRPPEDANPLKIIRREFYGYMAKFFHLEEVMPWTTTPPSVGRPNR